MLKASEIIKAFTNFVFILLFYAQKFPISCKFFFYHVKVLRQIEKYNFDKI